MRARWCQQEYERAVRLDLSGLDGVSRGHELVAVLFQHPSHASSARSQETDFPPGSPLMMITLANTDVEIAECFEVMSQLRPHLQASSFVERVRRMQADGFQLAALRDDGVVEAVAGFRIYENLVTGRQMYVDDLVTDDATRSRGYGRALLTWLADFAKADGCLAIELDSGTHRKEAHRFYFRERMAITAFHFIRRLDG